MVGSYKLNKFDCYVNFLLRNVAITFSASCFNGYLARKWFLTFIFNANSINPWECGLLLALWGQKYSMLILLLLFRLLLKYDKRYVGTRRCWKGSIICCRLRIDFLCMGNQIIFSILISLSGIKTTNLKKKWKLNHCHLYVLS